MRRSACLFAVCNLGEMCLAKRFTHLEGPDRRFPRVTGSWPDSHRGTAAYSRTQPNQPRDGNQPRINIQTLEPHHVELPFKARQRGLCRIYQWSIALRIAIALVPVILQVPKAARAREYDP